MTATNRWATTGKIRKNSNMKVRATLKTKATASTATAIVDDYYEFECTAKSLPAFKDAPTWNHITDNADAATGYTYVGKPEGLETIELTTESPIPLVYDELTSHMLAGDIFELKYTYDDSFETSIYTITVPNCQLLNVVASGGETNEGSTTVIKFNAAGGTDTWTLTQTSRVNAN